MQTTISFSPLLLLLIEKKKQVLRCLTCCAYVCGGGELRDVRIVRAWRKISFSLYSPSTLIGKYVQNADIFFSPFGFHCSVEYYTYINIQQRLFDVLPLHNFLVFFFVQKEYRTRKRRKRRRNDDTFWFSSSI